MGLSDSLSVTYMSARALLVSSDLFFISKVKEAAVACGRSVTTVRSQDALGREVGQAGDSGLIMIDLEKLSVPIEALAAVVKELSGRGWKVVSFFSHVHVETAETAREMGLGETMARSKFVRVLPELLSSL